MNEMRVASMAVGGVLGEFGGAHVHDDQALVVALEGRVELAHELDGALVVGADDDAVRAHEVVDGGAFLEEFRVGDDGERCRRRAFASSSAMAARTLSAVPRARWICRRPPCNRSCGGRCCAPRRARIAGRPSRPRRAACPRR